MSEFKIVISEKGKSYPKNLTSDESESFLNKKLKDKINGDNFGFKGYEFEITGGSDKEGFPMRLDVETLGRKKIFITKGNIGANISKKGLRLRKSIRGNTISQFISQINLKVIKNGNKSLDEIFGKTVKEEKPVEKSKETKVMKGEKQEKVSKEKPKEVKEEKPKEIKEVKKEEIKKEEKKEEPKIEEKKVQEITKEVNKEEKVEKVKEVKETDRIGYTEESIKKAQEVLSKLQEEKIKAQEKASQKKKA